ncbi:hypothetical protein ZIOFF_042827 [Zingiber officinale]|uniref:Sec-independent protein translocase protein TATA, chloroplastic n=1 Tax=Zingiber officinale TaxID=94328 RepID=A0A8J5FVG4_ZINOF|nr:hypothetical protein ZIOFF_042827 [Zingiber officinale]
MTTAMAFFSYPSCASLTAPPPSPRLSATPSYLAASSSLFFSGGRGRASLAVALRPRTLRRRQAGGGALGCRCLFGLGVPELVVIAGVAALVFGPKKLPDIGRSIGKTVKSFQQVFQYLFSADCYFCSLYFNTGQPYCCFLRLSLGPGQVAMHPALGGAGRSFRIFNLTATSPLSSIVQAAKEFETELKKDPEDSESSKSANDEDERKELETSGSKDASLTTVQAALPPPFPYRVFTADVSLRTLPLFVCALLASKPRQQRATLIYKAKVKVGIEVDVIVEDIMKRHALVELYQAVAATESTTAHKKKNYFDTNWTFNF